MEGQFGKGNWKRRQRGAPRSLRRATATESARAGESLVMVALLPWEGEKERGREGIDTEGGVREESKFLLCVGTRD